MKILPILFAACLMPLILKAQTKASQEPFKGAKKIIATYNISGDSLFTFISKALLKDGFVIASRDKELGTVATDPRHLKFIDYKVHVIVSDSSVTLAGVGTDGMGVQIGIVYAEPQWVDIDYRGRSDVRRRAFDDIIRFTESTKPNNITFSK